MKTESAVRACYDAWSASDISAILDQLHDDCIYALHVPTDILAFGGEHRGTAAIGACLQALLDEFSFLAFAVDWLAVDGDTARAQVVYYFDHIESGQHLDGRLRHVWHVENGKVRRVDEYHDTAKLGAFMEMVRSLRRT